MTRWTLGCLILMTAAAAGQQEVSKLHIPEGHTMGRLLAVSGQYGVAFLNIDPQKEKGQDPQTYTAIVDLKTGKVTPMDGVTSRTRMLDISPNGQWVLGVSGASMWVYDMKAKSLRTEGKPGADYVPCWWGDKVVALTMPGRKEVKPLSIVKATDGKPVEYPTVYGLPVAGSPDGKDLFVLALHEDVEKPITKKDMNRSQQPILVRLDAKGKILSRTALEKGVLKKPIPPTGRIVFDPSGRYLLTGMHTLEDIKALRKLAASEGGIHYESLWMSMASVTDSNTGKTEQVPTVGLGLILGFY